MCAREALLHEQYSRLAAAKVALEELHDEGEMTTNLYFLTTNLLTRCMAHVDVHISELQLAAELQWPRQCSDFDSAAAYHEYLRGILREDPSAAAAAADDEKSIFEEIELPSMIEISRLRITP